MLKTYKLLVEQANLDLYLKFHNVKYRSTYHVGQKQDSRK